MNVDPTTDRYFQLLEALADTLDRGSALEMMAGASDQSPFADFGEGSSDDDRLSLRVERVELHGVFAEDHPRNLERSRARDLTIIHHAGKSDGESHARGVVR
jgi:hypothetical protein